MSHSARILRRVLNLTDDFVHTHAVLHLREDTRPISKRFQLVVEAGRFTFKMNKRKHCTVQGITCSCVPESSN